MLRSHSLVAVGQEEDQPTLTNPLVLTRADELVNDALQLYVCMLARLTKCKQYSSYLSIVVEVSKLCLPDNQRIGVAHGEAQLKAKYCKLTQGAITDSVLGLGLRDV